MWNWRVILPVGLAVALALWGVSLWVKDNPSTVRYTNPGIITSYTYQGTPIVTPGDTGTVFDQQTANQRAGYLRFASGAIVLLTLASLPLAVKRSER